MSAGVQMKLFDWPHAIPLICLCWVCEGYGDYETEGWGNPRFRFCHVCLATGRDPVPFSEVD